MKNIKALSIVFALGSLSSIAVAGTPTGGGGGSGLVLEDTLIPLRDLGRFGNLNLLSAKPSDLKTIVESRGSLIFKHGNTSVRGLVTEPEFVDAISIETDLGEQVVIVADEAIEE